MKTMMQQQLKYACLLRPRVRAQPNDQALPIAGGTSLGSQYACFLLLPVMNMVTGSVTHLNSVQLVWHTLTQCNQFLLAFTCSDWYLVLPVAWFSYLSWLIPSGNLKWLHRGLIQIVHTPNFDLSSVAVLLNIDIPSIEIKTAAY